MYPLSLKLKATGQNYVNNMPYNSEVCPFIEIMGFIKISQLVKKENHTKSH